MPETSLPTILIVDDEPGILEVLDITFRENYRVLVASSGAEALEHLSSDVEISAVVMDIKMQGMDGIHTAREIKKTRPEIPIIFNTAFPGEYDETEIDANETPFDYVEKLEPEPRLVRAVRNAVEHYRMKKDEISVEKYAELTFGLFGTSEKMIRIFETMKKIAPTDLHVIIQGESGTGKKTIARNLHKNSPRNTNPIVHCSCREKSAELQKKELFGDEEATRQVLGLFQSCQGGTVILEDIDTIDLNIQTKILRIIEHGNLEEANGGQDGPFNVRVIGLTQENLQALADEGKFRKDLLYRMSGSILNIPPLRERPEDIPVLIEKYKARLEKKLNYTPKVFNNHAIQLLTSYDWPGNIRQLFATVENLVKTVSGGIINGMAVAAKLEINRGAGEAVEGKSLTEQVRAFEKSRILEVLKANDFNISASARQLKIDRANLYKKLKYHGIETPR